MDPDKLHQKVVVIRLPASFAARTNLPAEPAGPTGSGTQLTDINQIPDEVIAEMVSNQYKQRSSNVNTIADSETNDPNIMIDNSDPTQVDMYSTDHPQLAPRRQAGGSNSKQHASSNNNKISASNSLNTPTHYGDQADIVSDLESTLEQEEAAAAAAAGDKGDQSVQYKNYTPKQREWMLVVLSYSRGLLAKPFEMKLQDVVIEKAREVLKKNGPIFKLNDRIPTPRTLRGIWKNLWKHPERTVGNVNKGGRPRIDPALKRQKRNEREKWRRAALKQSKQMGAAGSGTSEYFQMDSQQQHQQQQPVLSTPRRSQRGQ